MRRVMTKNPRAGMTLVELLVVMLIITTLASLVLSAVFTVREAQMKNFTESLVQKLASGVDQAWKNAVDQIRAEPVPSWALTMAGNDPRIAKVIYLKARLKQEFPVSFYEAIYPNANYAPGATGAYQTSGGAADLPPKATYLKALTPLVGTAIIPNIGQAIPTPDSSLPANMQGFEASALLYLWLSQGRGGQVGFNPDETVEPTAIKTATVGGVTFKYFVDSWGGPVRAWTFPYDNTELNQPPYLQTTSASGVLTPQNQQSPDPQDPDQVLLNVQYMAFINMIHPQGDKYGTSSLRMLIPVVGSAGRDTLWGVDYFLMAPAPTAADPTAAGANDNIYSYRLRRVGRRGD